MSNAKIFSSREVFQWDEFKDLANRLGIPINGRVKSLSINLAADQPVAFTLVATCENDELKTTDCGCETRVCEALS